MNEWNVVSFLTTLLPDKTYEFSLMFYKPTVYTQTLLTRLQNWQMTNILFSWFYILPEQQLICSLKCVVRLQIRTLSSTAVVCSLLTMDCDRFNYLPVICNKDVFRDISLNSHHVMICPLFSQLATVGYSNTVFPSLFVVLNRYLGLHKTVSSTVPVHEYFICCLFKDKAFCPFWA